MQIFAGNRQIVSHDDLMELSVRHRIMEQLDQREKELETKEAQCRAK